MIICLYPFTAEEFKDYVNEFDVDEEIELHRQSEDYRQAFTIRQSLEDFEEFKTHLNEVSEKLENFINSCV